MLRVLLAVFSFGLIAGAALFSGFAPDSLPACGRSAQFTREFAGESREVVWEQEVPFERSGWLALRAVGPAPAEGPHTEAYAHTSPVYVDVASHPTAAQADAQYFLKW